MIQEYKFGFITIDDKTYHHDVEVGWETDEILDWSRENSHIIDVEDIERALEQNPETIIIGTGESGLAQVTQEVRREVKSRGITLIIDRTEAAVKTFNVRKEDSLEEEGVQERIIGLFHLTC